MKLLHTSDWHLGASLHGYDRIPEQAAMLSAIARIAAQERPDALLVAGDVFDHSDSPTAAYTLLVEKVEEMLRACPDMQVVISSGNHDSGSRLEIFREPWMRSRVHLIGTLPTGEDADLSRLIIPVKDKGWVLALPHLPRGLQADQLQTLLDMVAERNTAGLPVALMAHLAVNGCDPAANTRSEATGSIGNLECRDASELGTGYDYCALGHIHRPSTLPGGRVRYCGTPMSMSFDELPRHTVSIVEIAERGAVPDIREVEVPAQYELLTIPEEGHASWDDCMDALRDLDADRHAYVRLRVEGPAATDERMEAVRLLRSGDKAARFCYIEHQSPDEPDAPVQKRTKLTMSEFQTITPEEILERYFASKGITFKDEWHAMLSEALSASD